MHSNYNCLYLSIVSRLPQNFSEPSHLRSVKLIFRRIIQGDEFDSILYPMVVGFENLVMVLEPLLVQNRGINPPLEFLKVFSSGFRWNEFMISNPQENR